MENFMCHTEPLIGGITMTDLFHVLDGFLFWCEWALKPKYIKQNKVSLKYLKALVWFSSFHISLLVLPLVTNSSCNFWNKFVSLFIQKINNLGLGCRLLLECLSIMHETWARSPTEKNLWGNLKINTYPTYINNGCCDSLTSVIEQYLITWFSSCKTNWLETENLLPLDDRFFS